MITFSLDQANEASGLCNGDIYPEWVKTEKFYNCDNFYQSMSREKFFLVNWFRKKTVKQ